MKRQYYGVASVLAFAMFIGGCSTIPIVPSSNPHPHEIPYAVSLGERHLHAAMQYNPNHGEIEIRFFDVIERPYRAFKADSAKAILIVDGAPEREFYLTNARRGIIPTFSDGRFRYDAYSYTNHIDAQNIFLKNLSAFKLKAWLPLDGIVYEVTFVYPQAAIPDNTTS